tara:strand:+ start:135 stop:359 length:225 start_codon:yes stop_codon:yes gene_type:complete
VFYFFKSDVISGVQLQLANTLGLVISAPVLLSHYLFDSIEDVQNRVTQWLWIYNNERPNMALNGITPMMKLAAA